MPACPAFACRWVTLRQELLQTPHGRQRLLAGRPKIEGVQWIEEEVAAIRQVGRRRRRCRRRCLAGYAVCCL